jgi:hypothetical protein
MKYPRFNSVFRMLLMMALLQMSASEVMAQSSVYVQRNQTQRLYGQTYTKNNYYGVDEVHEESTAPTFQLRTNGLYDLALSPNIGLEWQSSFGMAFQFDYVGAWWNSPSKNRFFSNYGFQTEIRYYFKHKNTANPFRGLHAGVYGQMATFDFEFGGEGVQCPNLDDAWGLGLSGGYTLPISRRWAIDFVLGLGYFTAKYATYDPSVDSNGRFQQNGTKRLKFFGPTKLEVSFVWSLNKDNK